MIIMKNIAAAFALTCTMAAPASAATILVDNITSSSLILGNNDYQAELAVAGLERYTVNYDDVTIAGPARVTVYKAGSEAGFYNTLIVDGSLPIGEPAYAWDPNQFAASFLHAGGSLNGLIAFLSNNVGSPLYLSDNSNHVAVFLPRNFSGSQYLTNNLFVGLDDVTGAEDRDFDDYVIRISAVPEPGTWAMMILGFGLVGWQMRASRKRTTVAYA